jgi:hypothetical protein
MTKRFLSPTTERERERGLKKKKEEKKKGTDL